MYIHTWNLRCGRSRPTPSSAWNATCPEHCSHMWMDIDVHDDTLHEHTRTLSLDGGAKVLEDPTAELFSCSQEGTKGL